MLLEEEKAIVSHFAGTTRDIIEGKLNIGNITLNLIDTAGIRESDDYVEQIGITKAKEVLEKAELVLLVLDNSNITEYDQQLLKLTENKNRIIILNKMDLNNKANIDLPHIMISALKGEGLREIEAEIIKIAKINELNKVDATYLTNARQVSKLQLAYNAILDAIASSSIYLPVDMVELDIKKAWDILGEIIGISSGDELINELFSKFCLGK
jgi:tRNA modification GTPase